MQVKLVALVGCIAVSASLAGPLSAQNSPKYTRDAKKVDIKVKKTERTQGLERRAPQEKKKKVEPEITADEFIEVEGKVANIRDAQIQQFELLIEDTEADNPELPDLLFRLAELHSQKQRFWRFKAMELFPKIDKAKGATKSKLRGRQKNYFDQEKQALIGAIKVYAQIANNPKFKNYPRMDEALFYFAYTLDNAKRIKDARKVYHQLITNYPDSKYIPQAYLSFADYFFQNNDLNNAEKFYDKVLEFPQSSVYAYALYKKGWVYINQDRPQDALETFFKVANITEGKKGKENLNKASKKDFVRAYAEVGRAEKALKAFERVDKGYAIDMLKILGSIYLDQGQAEKAIYVYRELIGERPKDPLVCEWQGNVLSAMLTVGDNDRKAEEIEKLVQIYLKYKGNVLKGSALQECEDNARDTTSEMAKIWHNEATTTLNFDDLGHVEKLYNLYVESFPKAEDIGEMKYYYAELLWTRAENEKNPRMATERWEKAAIAFTEVVKGGKTDEKLKKESAYAAVLGWKNALAVDPRTKAPPPELNDNDDRKVPEPKPIEDRQQQMIDAFDVYIDYIKDPADEELVMMKFLKARIYWRYDHLDEAIPLFTEIVEKHPQHETAEYSINILLDSLIRMKKYDEMNTLVVKVLKDEKFLEDKDELAERLMDIKAKSMRKAAEQLEADGQHVECGLAYQQIYNENPDGPEMDQVLYNAGVCFEEGKSIGLAISMFEALSKRFPNSKLTQKALVRMGNAYGAIAYYDQAAKKYEEYASRFGGEKDAPGALQNAVTYRKGIGDDAQAIKNISLFVKQYKRKMKDEAADAMFGLAGIYEKQGNSDQIIKAYKEYLKEIGISGGRDRLLIANARIGEILWQDSCKLKNDDGSCVRVKRERATRRRGKRKGAQLPTQCGPESKIKLTVVERDPRLAKEAQKYFRNALAEAKKGATETTDEGRKAAAIYWAAAAQFYLAEDDYEQFLALEFPTRLDFSDRNPKRQKESTKRFLSWFENKLKLAVQSTKAFEDVRQIKGGGAAWAVAAAARIGQISQNFADGLYTAEIPADVRTGPYAEDGVDVYCDTLTEKAAPLEDQSVKAFDFCLGLSTDLNWFNKWSRLCERELGQIRPADYPTATELHAEPNAVAAITDTQSLIKSVKE